MRKAQQNHCFHSTEVTGKNNGSDSHINEKAYNNDLVSHNNNLLISNVCMHIIMHHVSHYYDLQSQKINWSEYGSPFIIVKDSTFRQSNQTHLKKIAMATIVDSVASLSSFQTFRSCRRYKFTEILVILYKVGVHFLWVQACWGTRKWKSRQNG